MKELLERWAKLEPDFCKLETHHSQVGIFYVRGSEQSFYALVYSDAYPDRYHPNKSEALMRIQWTVQAAMHGRKWGYIISYSPRYNLPWEVRVYNDEGQSYGPANSSVDVAEALLSAYLNGLEKRGDDNR